MTPGDALEAISEAHSDADEDDESLIEDFVEYRRALTPRGKPIGDRNAYIYVAMNGPCEHSELPIRPTSYDKIAGLRRYNLEASADSTKRGGKANPVYYVEGLHDEESVVECWADANQAIVERSTDAQLNRQTPSRWRPVMRSVLGLTNLSNNPDGNTETSYGGVCGLCGEEYEAYIAYHLKNNCQGGDHATG